MSVQISFSCECLDTSTISTFTGTMKEYTAWRQIHSGHRHLLQSFRTAADGPQVRYWCDCGSSYYAPASIDVRALFNWSDKHREHGIKGDIS